MGFELDFWDYVTFTVIALSIIAFLIILFWIASLPGKIAIKRNHPEAEAVKMLGWAGFLAIVPWIQAFIWAFKPTDVIDIRRFPKEEAEKTAEEIERLTENPGKI
jgi:hypothetical protein